MKPLPFLFRAKLGSSAVLHSSGPNQNPFQIQLNYKRCRFIRFLKLNDVFPISFLVCSLVARLNCRHFICLVLVCFYSLVFWIKPNLSSIAQQQKKRKRLPVTKSKKPISRNKLSSLIKQKLYTPIHLAFIGSENLRGSNLWQFVIRWIIRKN